MHYSERYDGSDTAANMRGKANAGNCWVKLGSTRLKNRTGRKPKRTHATGGRQCCTTRRAVGGQQAGSRRAAGRHLASANCSPQGRAGSKAAKAQAGVRKQATQVGMCARVAALMYKEGGGEGMAGRGGCTGGWASCRRSSKGNELSGQGAKLVGGRQKLLVSSLRRWWAVGCNLGIERLSD
jgi:hypothetical protein